MFAPLFRKFRQSKSLAAASHADATKLKLDAAIKPAVESLEERTLFSYAAPVTYAAGAAPIAVATADFNNDGRADVVATNAGIDNDTTARSAHRSSPRSAPPPPARTSAARRPARSPPPTSTPTATSTSPSSPAATA